MGKGSLATVLELTQTINGASFTSELDADERFGFTPQISNDGSTLAMFGMKRGDGSTENTISLFKKNHTTNQYDTQNVHIFNDINDYAINNYGLNSTGQFIAISYSKPLDADSKVVIFKHQNNTWENYGTIQPISVQGDQNHPDSGYTVSLSDDGNTIAIGNPEYQEATHPATAKHEHDGEGNASVIVYERNLTTNDWENKFDYNTWLGEEEGEASLNGDGTILAIGAPHSPRHMARPGEDVPRVGNVIIFKKDNGTWVEERFWSGQNEDQRFGSDVSLNTDGTIVMIGSMNEINKTKQKDIFELNFNFGLGSLRGSFDLDTEELNPLSQVPDEKSATIVKDIAVDNSGRMVAKVTRTFESVTDVINIKYDISVFEYINGTFIKIGEDISNIISFDPNLLVQQNWSGVEMFNGISLSGDGKTIAVGSLLQGDHGELKIYRVKE